MTLLRKLSSSTSGLAALEFALVLPVMVVLSLGTADVAYSFVATNQVEITAKTIAQLATSLAVVSDKVNELSPLTANQAAESAYVLLKGAERTTNPPKFGVAITSVVMTAVNGCVVGPTVPTCYEAHVAWSGYYAGSLGRPTPTPTAQTLTRACDTPLGPAMTPAANDAYPSNDHLPIGAYTSAPVLVVDVIYQYEPAFLAELYLVTAGTLFTKSFTAYFAPRTGPKNPTGWVNYTVKTDSPDFKFCPPYNAL